MNAPLPDPNFDGFRPVEPQPAVNSKRWGWGLILLWAYCLLCISLLVFLFFVAFLMGLAGGREALVIGTMLFPVPIFLVLAGVKNFKQ